MCDNLKTILYVLLTLLGYWSIYVFSGPKFLSFWFYRSVEESMYFYLFYFYRDLLNLPSIDKSLHGWKHFSQNLIFVKFFVDDSYWYPSFQLSPYLSLLFHVFVFLYRIVDLIHFYTLLPALLCFVSKFTTCGRLGIFMQVGWMFISIIARLFSVRWITELIVIG